MVARLVPGAQASRRSVGRTEIVTIPDAFLLAVCGVIILAELRADHRTLWVQLRGRLEQGRSVRSLRIQRVCRVHRSILQPAEVSLTGLGCVGCRCPRRLFVRLWRSEAARACPVASGAGRSDWKRMGAVIAYSPDSVDCGGGGLVLRATGR